MNIAILHYHLNRGGVTSVIANHLRSLNAMVDGRLRAAVLYGGRREAWNDRIADELPHVELSLHAVPELDYDDRRPQLKPGATAGRLAGKLRHKLAALSFSPENSLLHVHNHALGKNVSLPSALTMLAGDGFPLLLQIHDFAEDIRPQNYRCLAEALHEDGENAAALYPQGEHVHYATLNGRDRAVLCNGVVDERRVHTLPNPVVGLSELPPQADSRRKLNAACSTPDRTRWIVFPVRGIRRKNVGEMLLWSAVHGDGRTFGITLPPLNPAERPAYEFWKTLAAELQLPCRFDVGAPPTGMAFPEIVSAAEALLTTSIAEGFGMAFLETWLSGKLLLGRDLPEITADFKTAGMTFETLSPQFCVPTTAFDANAFRARFAEGFGRLLEAYGRPVPAVSQRTAAADALMSDGRLDFAYLDRELQAGVIRLAASDLHLREELRAANAPIAESLALDVGAAERIIQRNAAVVRDVYSPSRCGERLLAIYRAVRSSPRKMIAADPQQGERILCGFLRPERFHSIRCEP